LKYFAVVGPRGGFVHYAALQEKQAFGARNLPEKSFQRLNFLFNKLIFTFRHGPEIELTIKITIAHNI
jgi:hypothetical protein